MPRKPKLVPDWRQWPRMASVRLAALCAAFGLLPPEIQAAMLDAVGIPQNRVPAVMGVGIIVARLWAQQPKK